MRWIVVALIVSVAIGWQWKALTSIQHPPGILVPEAPLQGQVPLQSSSPMAYQHWQLTPRASFDLHGRVLSIRHYSDDPVADLSPMDVLIGWQRMSDTDVLDEIGWSQEARRCIWSHSIIPPIPAGEIIGSSANVHVIPANEQVLAALLKLKRGSIVRLSGLLVDAASPRFPGKVWHTSLSRTDDGDGSCEILWVDRVE